MMQLYSHEYKSSISNHDAAMIQQHLTEKLYSHEYKKMLMSLVKVSMSSNAMVKVSMSLVPMPPHVHHGLAEHPEVPYSEGAVVCTRQQHISELGGGIPRQGVHVSVVSTLDHRSTR